MTSRIRRRIKTPAGEPLELPAPGSAPPRAHVFEQDDIDALDAALAARRPLLVRGEPGTGKSQLAEAAARDLGWPLKTLAIHNRTEARDLLFEIDFVLRLAEAQLRGSFRDAKVDEVREELHLHRFTRPGPLWWAFAWEDAQQLGLAGGSDRPPTAATAWRPGKGCVVLIDEIDKAEADVPNGLLEVLGDRRFPGPDGEPVVAQDELPLIIVTSNNERELPDPFLRRCFVHWLELVDEEAAFVEQVAARGRAHYPEGKSKIAPSMFEAVARALFQDRQRRREGEPRPGLAEYIDLLRVLDDYGGAEKTQRRRFDLVRRYAFEKFSRPASRRPRNIGEDSA